jgi:hypothetical protein
MRNRTRNVIGYSAIAIIYIFLIAVKVTGSGEAVDTAVINVVKTVTFQKQSMLQKHASRGRECYPRMDGSLVLRCSDRTVIVSSAMLPANLPFIFPTGGKPVWCWWKAEVGYLRETIVNGSLRCEEGSNEPQRLSYQVWSPPRAGFLMHLLLKLEGIG